MSDIDRPFIENYFSGRRGRFIEIGAFDGITESMTIGLVGQGWEGLLVEANPRNFCKLIDRFHENKSILLVLGTISNKSGLAPFWDDYGWQVSSLVENHARAFAKKDSRPYYRYAISTFTAADLFAMFGTAGWNLIIIDVESMNQCIFRQLPFDKLVDTELIYVEKEGGLDAAALNSHAKPYFKVTREAGVDYIMERI